MKHRKQRHYVSRDEIIGIFLAPGEQKCIAARYGVSQAQVSLIKCGKRYSQITNRWKMAAEINAMLVSAACGVV